MLSAYCAAPLFHQSNPFFRAILALPRYFHQRTLKAKRRVNSEVFLDDSETEANVVAIKGLNSVN
jgi:hypothetical protein